MMLVTHR